MSSVYLRCPVTALKIHNNLLLAGQGTKLLIYSLQTFQLKSSTRIFNEDRIHKFCANPFSANQFVVIGGRSIKCIQVEEIDNQIKVSLISAEKKFNAWIWDGIWFTSEDLYLISAHNTVLCWNINSNSHLVISSCSNQCILYSATFGTLHNEVVVAVGTVFNKVLLWKPVKKEDNSHQFIETCKSFTGHEGVIFRICFKKNKSEILSVSDDRSIRIWSLEDESCLQILYGHAARVWDACFTTHDNVVSIGEDAVCLLWNILGSVLKKFTGHKGKSIWSLAVSDDVVVTGGGDGSIRQWNINDNSTNNVTTKELLIPANEKDYPRTLKFCNNEFLITSTNNGTLWTYNLKSSSWQKLFQDVRFSSYCVTEVNKSQNLVAIGNLSGYVKVVSLVEQHKSCELQLFDGKVHSIHWVSHPTDNVDCSKQLVVCGPEGVIKYITHTKDEDKNFSLNLLHTFSLPYSKQRWITCAAIIPCDGEHQIKLVCGDRRGSIHLYQPDIENPVQSILGVHGKTGVTYLKAHAGYIYTTGRDGSYQKYKYDANDQTLVRIDKQKACKGMDWIEGLYISNNDVVVFGFYMQSYFACWSSETSEILFKIKCGGGYRAWDVLFTNFKLLEQNDSGENSSILFGYLKGAEIMISSSSSSDISRGIVVQEALHGREVTKMKLIHRYSYQGQGYILLASCSEDTTINFYQYNSLTNQLKCLHTAVGHIGGVKDIKFIPTASSSDCHGFFLSCGSRTSLKCWKLSYKHSIHDNASSAKHSSHDTAFSLNEITSNAVISNDIALTNNFPSINGSANHRKGENCNRTNPREDNIISSDSNHWEAEVITSKTDIITTDTITSKTTVNHQFANNPDLNVKLKSQHQAESTLSCSLLSEIYNPELKLSKQLVKDDSLIDDMRYMDCEAFLLSELFPESYSILSSYMCIICACSDGIARVYIMHDNSYVLLCGLDYHKHCIQNARYHISSSKLFIFLSSTDGTISVWNIANRLNEYINVNIKCIVERGEVKRTKTKHINENRVKFHDLTEPLFDEVQPCFHVKCHQSGINSLEILELVPGVLSLVTGGDDNALYHGVIDLNKCEVVQSFSEKNAHTSSITDAKLVSKDLIISSGIDQRVKLWSLKDGFTLVSDTFTNIADVSSLETWADNDSLNVIITGVGIEIFNIKLSALPQIT